MSQKLRTSEVFVPGKQPAHTYNARDELSLERVLEDYIEEAGQILALAGPTKTGKTVLLRRVLENPVWLDGQGLTSAGEMWRRIVDEIGAYDSDEVANTQSSEGGGEAGIRASLPGLSANLGVNGTHSRGQSSRAAATRSLNVVGREALLAAGAPLVIDDFHFVEHDVQRELVRALKPLVLAGVPVIFVSISHRLREVVTAEPDMTGRVKTLDIDFWPEEDLLVIPRKGFAALNVDDPNLALSRRLAKESYGSPHLMQQFCRELCKLNNVRESSSECRTLEEPESWSEFFKSMVDLSSEDWALRFLRGPQERGSARTQYSTTRGAKLDGYGLCLLAITATGPKLSITKDDLRAEISKIVKSEAPGSNQITNFLKQMAKIAKSRPNDPTPVSDEDPTGSHYSQPVLDYVDDGPMSSLHLADPFFAFYLAWALDDMIVRETEDSRN